MAVGVIVECVRFIRDQLTPNAPEELRHTLSLLSTEPLDDSEIRVGFLLLQKHPLVQIVPNDQNRTPTGSVRVTHQFAITITDQHTLAALHEQGVAGVRVGRKARIEMIGVSRLAWGALEHENARISRTPPRSERVAVVISTSGSRHTSGSWEGDEVPWWHRSDHSGSQPRVGWICLPLLWESESERCLCTLCTLLWLGGVLLLELLLMPGADSELAVAEEVAAAVDDFRMRRGDCDAEEHLAKTQLEVDHLHSLFPMMCLVTGLVTLMCVCRGTSAGQTHCTPKPIEVCGRDTERSLRSCSPAPGCCSWMCIWLTVLLTAPAATTLLLLNSYCDADLENSDACPGVEKWQDQCNVNLAYAGWSIAGGGALLVLTNLSVPLIVAARQS